MFDLGWMELLIVGITALVVVGPKGLPVMFKKVGFFVGKARRLAREFQYNMEAAADDTGLKDASELLKTVDTFKSPNKIRKEAVKNVVNTVQSSKPEEQDKPKINTPTASVTNDRAKSFKNKLEPKATKKTKSSSTLKSTSKIFKE